MSRSPSGELLADPDRFPGGLKAVADYVHSKGLLFGVYTDRGEHTCVGRPGSQGYEKLDAKTYAEWGVDCELRDAASATQPQPQPQPHQQRSRSDCHRATASAALTRRVGSQT